MAGALGVGFSVILCIWITNMYFYNTTKHESNVNKYVQYDFTPKVLASCISYISNIPFLAGRLTKGQDQT